MTPKRFISIREKLGSQKTVATLIGLGERTLRRYEATSIPKWLEYAVKHLSEK